MSVRPNSPTPRRKRGPARWTPLEAALIIVSLVLIAFPLYIEAYRWINPLVIPAASRQQSAPSPIPEVPETPVPATAVPEQPSAVPEAPTTAVVQPEPTNADAAARSTLTPELPTAAPTNTVPPGTTVPATATTVGSTAVPATATTVGSTAVPATAVPTSTTLAGTATASPVPTITSTPPLGEAPLLLVKNASRSSAAQGESVSFAISVFTDKADTNTIEVRDLIDQQLEITSATSNSGTCSSSGNQVICTVTARRNNPAAINITVRVRADATSGALLKNQALAQDDRQFPAASDTITILVEGKPVAPAPTSITPPTASPSTTTGTPTTSVPTATSESGGGSGGSG
ncbi:MAG: hypothetical protein SH847_22930, partial [Roseiflexaceae bacterium]|nr:hypothetical protein [Roseiflexaceae bacterium]